MALICCRDLGPEEYMEVCRMRYMLAMLITALALATSIGTLPIACMKSGLSAEPQSQATIVLGRETIKTYPFFEPDPMPILARSGMSGRGTKLYPYSFFDKLSKQAAQREWTVVRMENPYISLAVLPEVGGKIWGATEKSTGREFIYTNHVLKFREIALRGPWVSGGIEFNFGIVGHTPAGATPVDYLVRENSDGSVSCFVGTLDLPSRTRWSVEIILPADRACFETRAQWYNPSPLHQSYYAWMNGAVHAGEDLEYCLPGRFHIGHDYSVPLRSWPMDAQGRDLSWYRNNAFGSYKSYFTVGEYEHFFGGYWNAAAFGFGHYALYDDMPGRKVWIWGLSRQGAIWEDLLTDRDGQYTEPQAGRLLNQSDHAFFAPAATDRWQETWFAYKDIGPMTYASPLGVLNVEQKAGTLAVKLCALRKIDEKMVVFLDGKQHASERITLLPMEVIERTFRLPAETDLCTVKVGGETCYVSDPAANDLERPIAFRQNDGSTTEGLFLAAERLEKARDYHRALGKYTQCLEREPQHLRALGRIAELRLRRAEYGKALSCARRALEISMYDPQANYIYGVLCQRLGKRTDAKEALGWAARSQTFRSSAYCRLAQIQLLEERFDLAFKYALRALDFNRYNFNASLVKAIALRKKGELPRARKSLDALLDVDPLNHAARFELHLLEPNPGSLAPFRSMIRSELPHEHYIEMALFYVEIGLTGEAVQLLELAAAHPVACYWLAFLRKDDIDESRASIERARGLPPELVFPFREETIAVLTWAMETFPGHWTEPYYLGLIYWSKGRIEEALELFSDIEPPDFAPFYLSRAHLNESHRPGQARIDLEKAVDLDRASWRSWHRLLAFYLRAGLNEPALAASSEAMGRFPVEDAIRVDRVRALMAVERFGDAAALLEGAVILPAEGATGVRDLFVRCHQRLALEQMRAAQFAQATEHLAKSKSYPENLGSGKPYDPDQRMEDYLLALCLDRTGERERAESLRDGIIQYTLAHAEREQRAFFAGLVLEHRGRQAEAEELLQKERPPEEVLEIIRLLEE